jgi:hypothetical protein
MTDLSLPALEGINPLGFLAALGVLDAVTSAGGEATLWWTDELAPHAVLRSSGNLESVLDVLDSDRRRWAHSPVLRYPAGEPLRDAKPDRAGLRGWFEAVLQSGGPADADLLCALVAEDALDGNGNAKPTHLHFTAGQQQFLEMARTLASDVDADRLHEAVCGPWAYDSRLPSLSWDARGERVYAVRATDPSKDKRLGVPGADWLAFRGLIFYPVCAANGSLRTTACDTEWKRSAFRWPLWSVPAARDTVYSLVADPRLVSQETTPERRYLTGRGVQAVLQAPIRRTDTGGYGSFGAPEILASSDTGARLPALRAG